MEEKEDGTSADHFGYSQNMVTNENLLIVCLLLGFKLISTVITLLMAGWIIITIITTKRLYKNHNIFVAHLLVNDIIFVLISLMSSIIMATGYLIGYDIISCDVLMFFTFLILNIYLTFLMISVDKAIAIAFPLRHKQIMKPRVVFGMIVATWVISVSFSVWHLFNTTGFIKVAKYGICCLKEYSIDFYFMSYVVGPFLFSILTIILDIYLTYKAYQIHKRIEQESKLSGGDSRQLEVLKKKQAKVKKHLKPMITLSVVMLGGTLATILLFPLYTLAVLVDDTFAFEDFLHQLLTPITAYISILLHPFVYGVYFKQIRGPMMRTLNYKGVTSLCACKVQSAIVTPLQQPGRQRTAWM